MSGNKVVKWISDPTFSDGFLLPSSGGTIDKQWLVSNLNPQVLAENFHLVPIWGRGAVGSIVPQADNTQWLLKAEIEIPQNMSTLVSLYGLQLNSGRRDGLCVGCFLSVEGGELVQRVSATEDTIRSTYARNYDLTYERVAPPKLTSIGAVKVGETFVETIKVTNNRGQVPPLDFTCIWGNTGIMHSHATPIGRSLGKGEYDFVDITTTVPKDWDRPYLENAWVPSYVGADGIRYYIPIVYSTFRRVIL